jgi:hypothetical protein
MPALDWDKYRKQNRLARPKMTKKKNPKHAQELKARVGDRLKELRRDMANERRGGGGGGGDGERVRQLEERVGRVRMLHLVPYAPNASTRSLFGDPSYDRPPNALLDHPLVRRAAIRDVLLHRGQRPGRAVPSDEWRSVIVSAYGTIEPHVGGHPQQVVARHLRFARCPSGPHRCSLRSRQLARGPSNHQGRAPVGGAKKAGAGRAVGARKKRA